METEQKEPETASMPAEMPPKSVETPRKQKQPVNKLLIVLGAAVVLMILIGVGIFVMSSRGASSDTQNTDDSIPIKEVSADEIGLEITIAKDGQHVLFDVNKTENLKHVEGFLLYEAVKKGNQGINVDMNIGDYKLPREFYLGTCSAVCTPHVLTTDITADLKITFKDGSLGHVKATFPVPDKSTQSSEIPE